MRTMTPLKMTAPKWWRTDWPTLALLTLVEVAVCLCLLASVATAGPPRYWQAWSQRQEPEKMATPIWTGNVSDNWGTAGNWTTGIVPTTGDTAIISVTATRDIMSGLTPGTTDLAALLIAEGSDVNIGGPGNVLTLDATKFRHKGNGTVYYNIASDRVATTQRHIVNGGATAKVYLSGANANHVEVVRGTMVLTADMTSVDWCFVAYSVDPLHDAHLVVSQGCGTTVSLEVAGGTVDLRADVTTLYQDTGTATLDGTGNIVGRLELTGGLFKYAGTSDDATQITALHLIGGVLDATVNDTLKTISAIFQMPGGELRKNADMVTNLTYDIGE